MGRPGCNNWASTTEASTSAFCWANDPASDSGAVAPAVGHGNGPRDTFDRENGYTSVRAQQGRVMLDADHNELVDIQRDDVRGGRQDIVGPSCAPADDPGFGVDVVAGVPTLSAGRFLLGGARLRNPADLPLSGAQPFLPDATLPEGGGEWLAYLEAWTIVNSSSSWDKTY